MTSIVGVLVLAFVVFASGALGVATTWLIYHRTRKRWTWLLAPLFALGWLVFVAVPLLALGLYLPWRAAQRVVPPPPLPTPVEVAPADDATDPPSP